MHCKFSGAATLTLAALVLITGCATSSAPRSLDAETRLSVGDPAPPSLVAALAPSWGGPIAPIQEPAESPRWEVGGQAYAFSVPGDTDYVQLALTADRGALHLEGRYNYEDLDTASLWAGYRFSGGEQLAWGITPMFGAVFGDTDGVAPGYRLDANWKLLELFTEGEYLFDSDDSDDNFFYSWTELTVSPDDKLRFGVVIQRTKVYDTDFDINRGFLLGLSFTRFDVIAHAFNLDDDDPVFALAFNLGL